MHLVILFVLYAVLFYRVTSRGVPSWQATQVSRLGPIHAMVSVGIHGTTIQILVAGSAHAVTKHMRHLLITATAEVGDDAHM